MIYTRRTKSIICCTAAVVAYFISLATIAGGAVLCQDASGASIEFACDHIHCEETISASHEVACDDEASCQCAACQCEDSPLILDMLRAPTTLHLVHTSNPIPTLFAYIQLSAFPKLLTYVPLQESHPPPLVDRTLEQRQTVVLIV